ncbi:MAG: hypothetical protein LBD79_00785 [Treponema sp.]|nr:hypothetical protein [Treponema sp.]
MVLPYCRSVSTYRNSSSHTRRSSSRSRPFSFLIVEHNEQYQRILEPLLPTDVSFRVYLFLGSAPYQHYDWSIRGFNEPLIGFRE